MIIRVDGLVKEFRRPRRHTGALGAVRTLFTRQYEATRAVDGVSFEIAPGELVGYLGPNGAGKSTTIKMLTGILVPSSGVVEVAGAVPWRERERNALQIGVVFGQRSGLWWDLPLAESFRLIGRLYRVPRARYEENLARFVDLLGMAEFLDTPVRQLSLGQRMRGDLAAAMLYEPRVLYLDEPTIGLDVVAKERIREFIAQLNREAGTTVVLTTHDLADVERLCRRLILIDHGRVLYDGTVENLVARYAPHRELVVHLAPTEGPGVLANSAPDAVAGGPPSTPGAEMAGAEIAGAELVRREEQTMWLRFDPARVAVSDLIGAVTARHPVTDLSIVEPELEGVVRRIYAQRAPGR